MLNLGLTANNYYQRKKSFIALIYTLNGLGNTTSSRVVLITIGRDGNFINTKTIAEDLKSASQNYLNRVSFDVEIRTDVNENTLKIVNGSDVYICVDILK